MIGGQLSLNCTPAPLFSMLLFAVDSLDGLGDLAQQLRFSTPA